MAWGYSTEQQGILLYCRSQKPPSGGSAPCISHHIQGFSGTLEHTGALLEVSESNRRSTVLQPAPGGSAELSATPSSSSSSARGLLIMKGVDRVFMMLAGATEGVRDALKALSGVAAASERP